MTTGSFYRADYHVHTRWCGHATGEMRDYVEAAIARGLAEIGFAAHMPVTIPIREKVYLTREELALYADALPRLRDEYAGRIRILMGGECDFAPGREREIEELIALCPFDYVLGSVHFIDGWAHDNPAYKERWDAADVAAVYRRYYELVAEAARSGYYDVVAHFDLVKKFGYQPEEDISDAEAAAADAVAEAGMTVEINAAGWDKPVGEQYPSERILRMLRERRIPICFGSDAHAPDQVARHFDRAHQLAREVGWSSVARFDSRRPLQEPRREQPLPS